MNRGINLQRNFKCPLKNRFFEKKFLVIMHETFHWMGIIDNENKYLGRSVLRLIAHSTYGYSGDVGNLDPALPFLVSIPPFQQTAINDI